MKLIGYTCTYNEADMVPYVMPYIERLGYDKFIVYDDDSTDNTVELLKQYPFVEVRSYHTLQNTQYDTERAKLMANSYFECKQNIFIDENGVEETTWMTWTDFDEVLYVSSLYDSTLKGVLEKILDVNGANMYNTSLVNILPPKEYEDVSLIDMLKPNQLVHELDGTRCKYIENFLGNKTCLFKVNDIEVIHTYPGNHKVGFKMENNKNIVFIESSIYFFHLKLVDKKVLKKKYMDNVYQTAWLYEAAEDMSKFDSIYNSISSTSYPLSDYFLSCDAKQLRVNENNNKPEHIGIYLI